MASASTSPSLSLSGQLLLQVSSPRVGRLGVTRQRSSSLSMAVGGPASPVQPPAQGNGGGGGQVHVATPRAAALMAVRGPTLLGHLPAEGTGCGGGQVHVVTPKAVALMMAVRGPTLLGHLPAEGTGGGGGKVHAAPTTWALLAVGGPTPPDQPPAEGGGGKIHAVPAAAPAAKSYWS